VIGLVKARLVAARAEVRRVAEKKSVRAIVAGDAVGVIEVLDKDAGEPFVAAVDCCKRRPAITGLAGCAVAEIRVRGAALAAEGGLDDEERTGGLLDVGQLRQYRSRRQLAMNLQKLGCKRVCSVSAPGTTGIRR